jgi:SAM-dependent methyltransferase
VGGSQKLGYRLAVEAGFTGVVYLPDGGQDDPAQIGRVIACLVDERADVVLGTPPEPPGARPARLGRYALARALRGLTGRHLSSSPSAFRGYGVAFLRRVFFEVNSNEEGFDMEILLQAYHLGARVVELPLPEGAPAPLSLPAVRDMLSSAAQYRMHQLGMLCSLRYRGLRPEVYPDKTEMAYSSHRTALELVRELAPRTLLDIGSGPGHLMAACESLGVDVTGVDLRRPLPGTRGAFIRHDLERAELPVDAFAYDLVLLLDVIEHLADPERFLIGLRHESRTLRPGQPATRLVISTPNVAFAAIRMNLFLGRFNYAERGILDITHKRLFTWSSLLATLRDCGYRVERTIPIGVPFEAVLPGPLGQALGRACDVLARGWPALFAFQIMVVCEPLPGVHHVLRSTGSADLLSASQAPGPPDRTAPRPDPG